MQQITHSHGENESWNNADEGKPVAQHAAEDEGTDGEKEVIVGFLMHSLLHKHLMLRCRWLIHNHHVLKKEKL